MRLHTVIEVLRALTGSQSQTEFGKKIGASQGIVSRMRAATDWELHWQIILNVLKLCEKFKIDPYAEDIEPSRNGVTPEGESADVAYHVRRATAAALSEKPLA